MGKPKGSEKTGGGERRELQTKPPPLLGNGLLL